MKRCKFSYLPISICSYYRKGEVILIYTYSEVPNRRADRNKRAGLEKHHPACFFTKEINKRAGCNFSFIKRKIVSRVERKSEKSKQACSSIRDLRVIET